MINFDERALSDRNRLTNTSDDVEQLQAVANDAALREKRIRNRIDADDWMLFLLKKYGKL